MNLFLLFSYTLKTLFVSITSVTTNSNENTTSIFPHGPPITPECSFPSPSPPPLELLSTDNSILRKSTRAIKTLAYLQDYVCNTVHLALMSSNYFLSPISPPFLSFLGLSSFNQYFVNCLSHIHEPTSYSQAILYPGWKEAMAKKIDA